MAALHDALTTHRDEVIRRWKVMVQGRLAPAETPTSELVDHLPSFVKEVIAALRADAGLPPLAPQPGESQAAADHGKQRLRLGFSLEAVVREYGFLHDAILLTGKDAGVEISFREFQVTFGSIVTGIGDAVAEYSRQRDAELQRQHNEHFAFVAHELRSPLYSAMMGLELLEQKGELRTGTTAAGTVTRSLRRMQELIDHSLSVARIASGVDLRLEPVKLDLLLSDAVAAVSVDAERKAVELRVQAPPNREVTLDVRLVRSALHNVVRNAVKYTAPSSLVELRGSVRNERVSIDVEDCCGGLASEDVEKAFAPFVRMTNRESGFGLGLAIAKQAVDAHGGSIRVRNLPGKGCVFTLEFPDAGGGPPGKN
ncbi:MAG TPA: sensor histidine kinase [Polyangiaceae bacterium]|nr:sensor histidine kinase [Polyangiaceae bacterium]